MTLHFLEPIERGHAVTGANQLRLDNTARTMADGAIALIDVSGMSNIDQFRLSVPVVMCVMSHGNNLGRTVHLIRVPETFNIEAATVAIQPRPITSAAAASDVLPRMDTSHVRTVIAGV